MAKRPSAKRVDRPTVALTRPRVTIGGRLAVGPGKIELLRAIARTGSISAAARELGMTYKRAWSLVDALNASFGRPMVERNVGGTGGGGAQVTEAARTLLDEYEALEAAGLAAAGPRLRAIARLVAAATKPPHT